MTKVRDTEKTIPLVFQSVLLGGRGVILTHRLINHKI